MEEVLFLSFDRAVLEPLRIVTCEDELNRAEKPLVELGLLVRKALADSLSDRDTTVLQFDHADRDSVHVQHQVGATFMATLESYLFGDRKVILRRVFPVDEMDGLCNLPSLGFNWHSISEQFVDCFVVFVQATIVVVGFDAQQVDGSADLQFVVTGLAKVSGKQCLLDVGVAQAISPIAEVSIFEFIAEQRDHTVLGGSFGFADSHSNTSQ